MHMLPPTNITNLYRRISKTRAGNARLEFGILFVSGALKPQDLHPQRVVFGGYEPPPEVDCLIIVVPTPFAVGT